jgi:hypothetical protein
MNGDLIEKALTEHIKHNEEEIAEQSTILASLKDGGASPESHAQSEGWIEELKGANRFFSHLLKYHQMSSS